MQCVLHVHQCRGRGEDTTLLQRAYIPVGEAFK